MRPSNLRPSILSSEGLALLEKESIKGRFARFSEAKNCPTEKAQPEVNFRPVILCRLKVGGPLHKRTFLIPAHSARTRLELHCAITSLAHRLGLSLHAVLEYGDEQ